MNRRTAGFLIALAAAGAMFAGCGPSANAQATPVATTTVDLPKSYRFAPAAIVVEPGATVTWTNHDNFTHNVTVEGQPGLTMKPGESVTQTFPTAGTYSYVCSLHPTNMKGTVTVKAP
jgi:plastocyanin